MDQTVCYGSDEEENDSDITYVESTDEESENIMNNPFQGPSQQAKSAGITPAGPNAAQMKPSGAIRVQARRMQAPRVQASRVQALRVQASRVQPLRVQASRVQTKSHPETNLWRFLKLTVTLIAM